MRTMRLPMLTALALPLLLLGLPLADAQQAAAPVGTFASGANSAAFKAPGCPLRRRNFPTRVWGTPSAHRHRWMPPPR
jgi:hypothetical protein